jgi:5-methylcytosine-specific restriction protein B
MSGVFPFTDTAAFDLIRNLAMDDPELALLRVQLSSVIGAEPIVQIYYGPPGTGKTLEAVKRAVELADPAFGAPEDFQAYFLRFNELLGQVAFVTFHQSLQYGDVAEAIRPQIAVLPAEGATAETAGDADDEGSRAAEGGTLSYRIAYGPIMRLIESALHELEKQHVLVIDEINRGDISRILGPMISAIERDKRVGGQFPIGFEALYPKSPDADSRIFVPANLHIIGTMNSADRNIALVDHALRRRFEFVEVPSQPGLLAQPDGVSIKLEPLLRALNERIGFLLDRDHHIGHGYLMGVESDEEVVRRFALRLIPLLREYFYGAEAQLLLVVGDAGSAGDRIFRIENDDESFEDIFGVSMDAALDIGYRSGRRRLDLTVDPRFWDATLPIPAPRDLSYAVASLQKIYKGGGTHEAPSPASPAPEPPIDPADASAG